MTVLPDDVVEEDEEGYEGEEIICLVSEQNCFNVTCDGGSWQYEVSGNRVKIFLAQLDD